MIADWHIWLPVAALALAAERLIGYPAPLQRAIGHPVQWMGGMIAACERGWNRPTLPPALRTFAGAFAMALLLLFWGGLAWLISAALTGWLGAYAIAPLMLLATTLLAQRSLREHVAAVAHALEQAPPGDLAPARAALSMIVGRDVSRFDESRIAHATVETLAENASDGIVAPLFWLMLAGLPGIVAYKLVNTADSMIGHLNARYRHFGRAAARLDDLMNWIPARLTGLLYALAAGGGWRCVLRVMWRDARKHVSPNAGWPESAMAAALGVRLGGPRSYQGRVVDFPWLGEGRARLSRADIHAALALHGRMLNLLLALCVLIAAIFLLLS